MHPARFPHLKPSRGIQLNRSHPLVKGLIGCWIMNEGVGNIALNLADSRHNGTLINNTNYVAGRSGSVVDFDGTTDYITFGTDFFDGLSQITSVFGMYADTVVANDRYIAKWDNNQSYLMTAITDDTLAYAVSSSGGSSNRTIHKTDAGVLVTGSWLDFAIVWNGNLDWQPYLNGVAINDNVHADAGTVTTPDSNADVCALGADGSGGDSFDGRLDYYYVYNRALMASEILQLYREPYAMFQQNRARWFFVGGGGTAFFASLADTVGITDDINTQVGAIRNIADNVGITDTIITGVRAVRSIADNVGISDTITKIGTYIRTLADNLSITDTINTARNLKKSMADNVGITDVITGSVFKLVSLADTIGITDVLSHIGTFIRSIPDTIGITDAITTIKTAARNIADTVGITDVITSEKFVLVSLADTVGITDTLTIIGTYIRSIIDGVGITDVLTKIGTYKRSIADTAGITDTITTSKGVVRNIADTIGITDVISAIVGKVASIADTIGITDVLTFIKTTVVGGRVFISGIARSLRISGSTKSLRITGEDKSLKISGSGD